MGGKDTVILLDQIEVIVRPITPGDADALVRFHRLLSRRSKTQRYFYPHLDLSGAEVAHLTQVDGRDRVALVVEYGGRLIAVGRYERIDASAEAEVAFVVADDFQGHGIAPMLLHRLARLAEPVGIDHFIAEVLVDNRTMLNVFQESGFPTELKRELDSVEVKMAIQAAVGAEHQHGTRQMTVVPPDPVA
jgi:GNAT superfamily N-acetyltransferase